MCNPLDDLPVSDTRLVYLQFDLGPFAKHGDKRASKWDHRLLNVPLSSTAGALVARQYALRESSFGVVGACSEQDHVSGTSRHGTASSHTTTAPKTTLFDISRHTSSSRYVSGHCTFFASRDLLACINLPSTQDARIL